MKCCLFDVTLTFDFVLVSCILWDPRASWGPGCVPISSCRPVSELREGETEQNNLLFIHSLLLLLLSHPSLKVKQVLLCEDRIHKYDSQCSLKSSLWWQHSHNRLWCYDKLLWVYSGLFTNNMNICLFRSISTASQDSVGFFLVKSGSVSRTGTSTWASPVADTAAPPNHQSTTSSSSSSPDPSPGVASNTFAACGSTALPGSAANQSQLRSPTQKQCSEQGQLEPILEAPPDSPRGFVKITSPYKRKSNVDLFSNTGTLEF